jgi:hypothetical protein
MNKLLSQTARALPATLVFAAAAVLSTGAHANEASKKALAVKLAQFQQKNESAALANQITQLAVQPLLARWEAQVESRVPVEKQKEVSSKLNAELNKFGDSAHQAIEAQTTQTAQDALVPVLLDKLSEAELKTILNYLESPASAKFAALLPDAANAWGKKVVETTQPVIQGYARSFEETAEKIVAAASTGAPAAPAVPAPAPAAAPPEAPASSASEAE